MNKQLPKLFRQTIGLANKNYQAISSKYYKLITSLRSAYANEYSLD
jgi:hypothetical protein